MGRGPCRRAAASAYHNSGTLRRLFVITRHGPRSSAAAEVANDVQLHRSPCHATSLRHDGGLRARRPPCSAKPVGAETKSGPGSDARLASRPHTGVTTSIKSGGAGPRHRTGRNAADAVGSIERTAAVAPVASRRRRKRRGNASTRRGGRRRSRRRRPCAGLTRHDMGCDSRRFWRRRRRSSTGRSSTCSPARRFDPARVTVGGFSDGASYALSLGLANGDLFPRVLAFSPGFVISATVHGRPRFFVSHGTSDQILPIDECSRVIVPRLRSMGYDVTFREFDGRHEVPQDVAREGMRWTAATAG